ncbi:hypothetical protein [Streptomyces sp. NPDC127197]|uniref:hypothetical protein n=1 Tax=Streptomyces sp. NPDC127197 TaxID=3345388 RepID=UPI0036438CE7
MMVVVNDERLLELPDSFDWAEGSALTVNCLTAYLSLTRVAQVQPGQSALVCGATGGVGHAVVQTSKALGARPITVVSSAHKARWAIEAGRRRRRERHPSPQGVDKPAAGGRLRPVIDSRFALDDFEDGHTRLASREAIGSIVVEL